MAITAYRGADIFDGLVRRSGHALLVDEGRVWKILPQTDVPGGVELVDLPGGLLAPGFIDVQVNGGGGVLLNDQPTVAGIRAICEAHARFGSTALMPTVITDRPETTFAAIEAVGAAMAESVAGCIGIHVEGPFLSTARKGAHDPALIRTMSDDDLARFVATTVRPMILTVATESVTPQQISTLAANGITVSIGHSDATFEDAKRAFDAGARGVTHLFNAMSQLGHRSPGLVGAALQTPDVWCGIIADGYHVHPAAIDVALRAKQGEGTMMAITDAMPTVGVDEGVFELNGRTVRRSNGRLTLDDGTLAGSDLTMIGAVQYLVGTIGVPLEEALRMASLYPATFLGLQGERGALTEGLRADMVWMDTALNLRGVWIGGRKLPRDGQEDA
ncbi:N-acetylglucosamine-6-phosphate deacetylase [Aureimonas altamirensis]|uniref:N-acetylglucosamine-6-phosphate deacetylase n=1 Tax=Aureimonas altamirensis TaxID=370622 RepID=UPI001E4349BF|nr:N-acetylglucosamine-6-phosphate deacetylase [Aureimonas altamirensis]UHD44166.1 N-acetylglucosamine-6-phosphate deacetylase [Aureimonas altamirensis]